MQKYKRKKKIEEIFSIVYDFLVEIIELLLMIASVGWNKYFHFGMSYLK